MAANDPISMRVAVSDPDTPTHAIKPNADGSINTNAAASATGGASFAHIAAGQATTVVKASAGTLYSIVFNGVATSTNVTTVYDDATGAGTVIAIPQATLATGLAPLTYGAAGLAFANGLTIITTTANGADMTVVYK